MRDKVCCMFGMGQPSNPLVVALSLTKSRVSRNSPFTVITSVRPKIKMEASQQNPLISIGANVGLANWMYLVPMGSSRFLDNPKFEQCLNLGAYRVLFFSRVVTLCESVLWQLPFRSVYLDDHPLGKLVTKIDKKTTKSDKNGAYFLPCTTVQQCFC